MLTNTVHSYTYRGGGAIPRVPANPAKLAGTFANEHEGGFWQAQVQVRVAQITPESP